MLRTVVTHMGGYPSEVGSLVGKGNETITGGLVESYYTFIAVRSYSVQVTYIQMTIT
jgi:hypothetical protein